MPSSSCKLVVRQFVTEGFDRSSRAILNTGIGPTLIILQVLPYDTQLQPLGELASMFHDVNGGWLAIVGSVCLGVALAGQTSYNSLRVVDNTNVPAILGTSFVEYRKKECCDERATCGAPQWYQGTNTTRRCPQGPPSRFSECGMFLSPRGHS